MGGYPFPMTGIGTPNWMTGSSGSTATNPANDPTFGHTQVLGGTFGNGFTPSPPSQPAGGAGAQGPSSTANPFGGMGNWLQYFTNPQGAAQSRPAAPSAPPMPQANPYTANQPTPFGRTLGGSMSNPMGGYQPGQWTGGGQLQRDGSVKMVGGQPQQQATGSQLPNIFAGQANNIFRPQNQDASQGVPGAQGASPMPQIGQPPSQPLGNPLFSAGRATGPQSPGGYSTYDLPGLPGGGFSWGSFNPNSSYQNPMTPLAGGGYQVSNAPQPVTQTEQAFGRGVSGLSINPAVLGSGQPRSFFNPGGYQV